MEDFLNNAIMNSAIVSLTITSFWWTYASVTKDKRYKSGKKELNLGIFKVLKIFFYSSIIGIPLGIALTLFGGV